MTPNVKSCSIVLTFVLFFFLPVISTAQSPCKGNFNYALDRYQKGQFESINASLTACVTDIKSFRNDYLNNTNGRRKTTVFKVYKLIINAYRNLAQDNLANLKMNELVIFFSPMARDVVQAQLNATLLQAIE
ncbi:MAG: hypothetical protein ABJB86_10940 [Bacteroidota bacterium]